MAKKLKNLASCTPKEFLLQTNKIRKSVEKWLTVTDIKDIRRRKPVLSDNMTESERNDAISKQTLENLNSILDEAMEKHPDETLEVLALASFVDPKDVNKHSMSEYLGSLSAIMQDENVMGFFMSLVNMAQRLGTAE